MFLTKNIWIDIFFLGPSKEKYHFRSLWELGIKIRKMETMEKWGSDYSKPLPMIKNLKLMFEITINIMDKWRPNPKENFVKGTLTTKPRCNASNMYTWYFFTPWTFGRKYINLQWWDGLVHVGEHELGSTMQNWWLVNLYLIWGRIPCIVANSPTYVLFQYYVSICQVLEMRRGFKHCARHIEELHECHISMKHLP